MINNTEKTSYGFVSESQTIAKDSRAKITVKVRVYEDAVAYIYLVDTTKSDNLLNVISHDFKGDDGKDYSNKLFVKVTASDMDYDGWANVTFYVAAGKTPISYRVEMWNGERTTEGQNPAAVGSLGYVFFDDLVISTYSDEASVLAEAEENTLLTRNDYVYYTRALDEVEKEYNEKQTATSDMVSYKPSVVWADNFTENNNGTLVFAIYNTIDPTPIDPNVDTETDEDEETETSKGCADVDPSTFWLSFSSILLGAALIAAMIMLVVKKIRSSKKKNANDAKSHYKVTSRNKTVNKVRTNKAKEDSDFDDDDEVVEEVKEEETEETTTEEATEEEYQYGEVLEDFGDDNNEETEETTTEEVLEETTEESSQEDTEKQDN